MVTLTGGGGEGARDNFSTKIKIFSPVKMAAWNASN